MKAETVLWTGLIGSSAAAVIALVGVVVGGFLSRKNDLRKDRFDQIERRRELRLSGCRDALAALIQLDVAVAISMAVRKLDATGKSSNAQEADKQFTDDLAAAYRESAMLAFLVDEPVKKTFSISVTALIDAKSALSVIDKDWSEIVDEVNEKMKAARSAQSTFTQLARSAVWPDKD